MFAAFVAAQTGRSGRARWPCRYRPRSRKPIIPTGHCVLSSALRPGGSNDIVARLLAEKLNKSLGQPAIVENKPGGGGAVAAAFVKSQPADGYTLLVGASGAMVVGPAIGAPASYETLGDFDPVSILVTFPLVFIVNAESPHKTLKDFVAWSKANPSASNYGSASPTFTLAAELLKFEPGLRCSAFHIAAAMTLWSPSWATR